MALKAYVRAAHPSANRGAWGAAGVAAERDMISRENEQRTPPIGARDAVKVDHGAAGAPVAMLRPSYDRRETSIAAR